ncbi:MAG: hypothetical protein PHF35_00915 [Candidatus Moranbacteria bacterium]|nr:hypothetical protein [Candidatus Moranbacteria bacterium]
MKKNIYQNQNGQIIMIGLVFFAIILIFSSSLIAYTSSQVRLGRQNIAKSQALRIAEAGLDQAVYQLNQSSNYDGETSTNLGNGVFTVTVSSVNSNIKEIVSTGYVPDSANPIAVRTVKSTFTISDSIISFNYGVQAGNGGFVMSGGSVVNGNIYSNGNIVATSGVHITGSATAANSPSAYADQVNDSPDSINSCTSSSCITFANSSGTQDFAQSFRLSDGLTLNNIQFYIKKVGSPSNITLRIVNDNGGNPGTDVLMTGTLNASTVTSSFGWVTVTLPSTPVLNSGQTYWMVLDASSNSSKYYIIGANSSYSNGIGKIGKYGTSWSDTSPAGLDGYFRIFLGGATSTIGGSTYVGGVYIGTTSSDIAWAHSIIGASTTGTLYCKSGSYNNKACDSSRSDPDPQPMPLSDGNIQGWKNEAEAGGVISGDYHVGWAGATLGPKVITGDLLIDGGGILNVTGTLYIKGDFTLTSGGRVKLDESYGESNGIIIVDGNVSLTGGSNFSGSGQEGSYPFLITTSSCPTAPGCNGDNAIYLSGGAGTVALIAQDGNALINGGSALKEVTAKQITMSGGAQLIYDSGLVNANFSSGPGGSWEYKPGTYVIVK